MGGKRGSGRTGVHATQPPENPRDPRGAQRGLKSGRVTTEGPGVTQDHSTGKDLIISPSGSASNGASSNWEARGIETRPDSTSPEPAAHSELREPLCTKHTAFVSVSCCSPTSGGEPPPLQSSGDLIESRIRGDFHICLQPGPLLRPDQVLNSASPLMSNLTQRKRNSVPCTSRQHPAKSSSRSSRNSTNTLTSSQLLLPPLGLLTLTREMDLCSHLGTTASRSLQSTYLKTQMGTPRGLSRLGGQLHLSLS
ncbi:uncharacterized protein LOC103658634 [Ursus maritimus]|uniref:Uncharacterized protein LOC103658634 n=1 Tax=Ursus maritimus TaxID=29073 RepID=A0A384BQ56_URSMA|nr:uncharacterized protein LOC103658634 [Ursus maritimus]